ncbi:hypothetical protein [Paenibacillus sp. EPM92]|uniref:hypothetical protein n=1 Tax=Paenibacillus sp. EPM92 TaxID=1561195 RepID=UPI0019151AC3|nr:hypothetical protein [Paenibacillus sp. EPM92]
MGRKIDDLYLENQELYLLQQRKCSRCLEIKELSAFPFQKKSATGYAGLCRKCSYQRNKAAIQRRRERDPLKELNYKREYQSRPEVRGKVRERYVQSRTSNPEKYKAKEATQKQSEKGKARNALRNAVHAGKIVKPEKCEQCKTIGNVEGHHPDYSKPLEVVWLCRPCHRKVHWKENQQPTG